jgi:hypothetical protein
MRRRFGVPQAKVSVFFSFSLGYHARSRGTANTSKCRHRTTSSRESSSL